MDKIKDNGVSPVIATILLIALSIVLISLVSIAIMAGIGSFTPVENKVVGFTVEVNSTDSTALVTPVSGTDLPFLESYRVYTNNGYTDSPDAQGIGVTGFDSTVTYVNIVGNFTDHVTALVFSGKVVVEGGVIVVEPVVSPYYVGGSEGYNTTEELADSINDWYAQTYGTTTPAVIATDNSLSFENLYPIIISSPLEISKDNIDSLKTGNFFVSAIAGGGTILRAPKYDGPLLVIGVTANKVTIESGTLTIGGDNVNTTAASAAVVIKPGASLEISNHGSLVIQNNNNANMSAPGGGLYNQGSIVVKEILTTVGNSAYNGGGIYNSGTISLSGSGSISVRYNHAVNNGGGVYNAGFFPSPGVSYEFNTADGLGPDIYNA